MIAYQDFVPQVLDRGGFLRATKIDTLRASIFEANRWIKERGIKVFNVETVVLPNIHSAHEEGSEDSSLHTSGELHSTWHQFIRVWYELEDGPPPMP